MLCYVVLCLAMACYVFAMIAMNCYVSCYICYVFAMFRNNFTSYGLCHKAPSCSGLNWCVNFRTSPSLTIDSRVLIF